MDVKNYNIVDVQYSRKIIPQVGLICGALFFTSGVMGLTNFFVMSNKPIINSPKVYIISSSLLLVSGYYLITYFTEYIKQV
jgi:hypothetical protein